MSQVSENPKPKKIFRFKSIASRIIWSVVPIVFITTLVSAVMIYFVMNRQVDDQFNERMIESVNAAELKIDKELLINEDIAQSLAVFATACRLEEETDNIWRFNTKEEELIAFVEYMIGSNPNTAGGGIWYEPDAISGGKGWNDYYAAVDDNGVSKRLPYEYFYDEDWYVTGIVSSGETVWSSVYNDLTTGLTMITSTIPIFSEDGTAIGVATADMALNDIKQITKDMAVGDTGAAMLLGNSGEYVAFLDDSRDFTQRITADSDAALTSLGNTVLSYKSGMTAINYGGQMRRAYYKQVAKLDWHLVLMINEAEVGSAANSVVLLLVIVPVIGLTLAVVLIFFIAAYIRRIAGKVNSFAAQAADGVLDGRIKVTESDEFGQMETNLNLMMDNMADMKVRSEKSLKAAQEANAAKTQFLSKMSHEMRTPMNAVLGMTQIAAATDDKDKIHDCLEKITFASKSLLELINNILDMAKIEANKIEIDTSPFDFRKVAEGITGVYGVKADEKNIGLSISFSDAVPYYISSDELRYGQILTNIIGNALKFTPAGGRVTVEIDAANEDGKHRITTCVRDNGIGIKPEAAEKLFNLFEQADSSTSRKYGGTGLGLSISRSLAQLLGGDLRYKPNDGGGSCFIFDIIAACADAPVVESVAEDDLNFDFSGRHIMVAEDIEINREIVAAFVESTDVSIDFAENGLAAVQLFMANPARYDLIFMDIQMPEMDGHTAAETIRSLPGGEAVPIYAMSANAFKEDVDASLASGMNGHLAKPLNATEVLKTMATVFKK